MFENDPKFGRNTNLPIKEANWTLNRILPKKPIRRHIGIKLFPLALEIQARDSQYTRQAFYH
jgi:hypothetical protein